MDVQAYLERIHYAGPVEPGAEVLRGLQYAHLLSVPFENLDIGLGRPIRLEPEALFDKIVNRRRGGFCYELNGLFAWLLRTLGFDITNLSASDAHEDGTFGPEFDHLALLVRCPDSPAIPWLVDVGWGDTFRYPLRLDVDGEQPEPGGRCYWFTKHGEGLLLWQRDVDGFVERQYHFTLQPRRFEEYGPMCIYHQTSPASPFTQKRICTRLTPDGRITLSEGKLVITRNGQRETIPVEEAEWEAILVDRFGIRL